MMLNPFPDRRSSLKHSHTLLPNEPIQVCEELMNYLINGSCTSTVLTLSKEHRLVLCSSPPPPQGDILKYAIELEFPATNTHYRI
jgi:hypothetical protein